MTTVNFNKTETYSTKVQIIDKVGHLIAYYVLVMIQCLPMYLDVCIITGTHVILY